MQEAVSAEAFTSQQLPTLLQQVIHKSRYARWNEEYGRRESWYETVARYCNFFQGHFKETFDYNLGTIENASTPLGTAFNAIFNLHVMPSMRCLMTAGPALKFDPLCGFNCTYRAVTDINAFDEIMYILMCGCGAGFSVERQFIGQLPMIPKKLKASTETMIVEDSRAGWASSYRTLITRLYSGNIPSWDISKIRLKGTRLKTMGGYASGPGPLVDLFKFTIAMFERAKGRRLSSIECHDLMCKVGDIVVAGGVRRSALISLSNLSDHRMRDAKAGNWWDTAKYRSLANNSVAYTEKPPVGAFMEEWLALYNSKSGERGIVNRMALVAKAALVGRRTHWDDFADSDDAIEFGCNPCAEITLRSKQTCNLSEVIARTTDTPEILTHKAGIAGMLGTWQATLSGYKYVDEEWRKNAEEERLLGVSTTGIMDNPILSDRHHEQFNLTWSLMKEKSNEVNRAWARQLGINHAAASTCVKPSGTVSQLVNSSSGIHSRWSDKYVRRITVDNKEPMCQFLKDNGVPFEVSEYKPEEHTLFTFPIRAPYAPAAVQRSAIEQLEHWKAVNNAWAEHSVSCTVNVEEQEWPEVGGWVYKNFDELSGVSFLPKSNTVYAQLPNEPCDETKLVELESMMPTNLPWDQFKQYEKTDTTTTNRELACSGDKCEIM